MSTYIIERTGWSQWYDGGGRWVSNRDAAQQFADRESADAVAADLNAEFGSDDAVVVEA